MPVFSNKVTDKGLKNVKLGMFYVPKTDKKKAQKMEVEKLAQEFSKVMKK